MQKYELMILYKPLLMEDIKKSTVSSLTKMIEKSGGSLTEIDNLGKRLLAYPIKKFEEGHYVEYELLCDAKFVDELKNQLKLEDNVLRYLLITKK